MAARRAVSEPAAVALAARSPMMTSAVSLGWAAAGSTRGAQAPRRNRMASRATAIAARPDFVLLRCVIGFVTFRDGV